MHKYGIIHKVSTSYHPQTNGQAKLAGRESMQILEKSVNPDCKDWSSRLSDGLWAYRTAYTSPLECLPIGLFTAKPAIYCRVGT